MSDILTTKLHIPKARQNLVPRPRLTKRLQLGMEHKLTLISAPAGFGKTTMLSEWIPQSERCVTWVSLDDGDNDHVRFWTYFIAALQMVDVDFGKKALAFLQYPQPPPIEAILTILLNEIAGFRDYFALVLDDYQIIQTQPIHASIQYFLEHIPPQMHLVISSRSDPPLPLGRLRARDQLNEIRSEDLRFTPDETAAFLNQSMGLNLSTENVSSLEAHTEGWIAGLQLAGLALQGRGSQPDARIVSAFIKEFTGSHRYIVGYLVEEVLSQLPKGTIDFLLQTSILDSLSGPLCDFVLGKSNAESSDNGSLDRSSQLPILNSQIILEQLEHGNLFIVPLDEEGKWYRYHHLFAEVLRARLQSSQPGKLRKLHLLASVWYEESGNILKAVRHALEAEEWERAAWLIEQHALAFGLKGQIHLLLGWLNALPESVVLAHPMLCVFHAGTLMYHNRLEDAAARLRHAEKGIQADTPADRVRLILGRVAMVGSNLARIQGDTCNCVELAQRALEFIPNSDIVARANAGLNLAHRFLVSGDVNQDNEVIVTAALESVRTSGNVNTTLRGTTLLARLRALQGRLHRSEEIYAQALEMFSDQNGTILFPGIPDYFFGLGELKREWNLLDESETILAQGIINAQRYLSDGNATMHGYQSLARLKLARGDIEGAKAILEEFVQLARQHHLPNGLLASVWAHLAWLDLIADKTSAADRWAETSGIQIDDEVSFPREREYLTLVRLYIRKGMGNAQDGHTQQALRLLDRLQAAAQAGGRMGSVIEIFCLQALAFQGIGDLNQARESIGRAIALARQEGYIRTFVDEGDPMRSLISDFRLLSEKQPHLSISLLSYLDRLLAAFPGATPDARPASNRVNESEVYSAIEILPESLSDRELAVLRLIAAGASNAEIAKTLIIAISTVKRHTGNLYGKLGVNSRTRAIVRAQELGLLS